MNRYRKMSAKKARKIKWKGSMINKFDKVIPAARPLGANPAAGLPAVGPGQTSAGLADDPELREGKPYLHTFEEMPIGYRKLDRTSTAAKPWQAGVISQEVQWLKRAVKIIWIIIIGLFLLARIEHWDPGRYSDIPDYTEQSRGEEKGGNIPGKDGEKIF
jgi:hypothetical protein